MKTYLEITLLKIEKPREQDVATIKSVLVFQKTSEKEGLVDVETMRVKSFVEVPLSLIGKKVMCEVTIVPYSLDGRSSQLSIKALSVKAV